MARVRLQLKLKTITDIAEKAVGIPGWTAYVWRAATNGSLVTGCVPYRLVAGKNKGKARPVHPKSRDRKTVVVSDSEVFRVAEEYERDTGKCWNCEGSGQVVAGWSNADGTKYRACARCKKTGLAGGAS